MLRPLSGSVEDCEMHRTASTGLPILFEVQVASLLAVIDQKSLSSEEFHDSGRFWEDLNPVHLFGKPNHGWVAAQVHA